MELKRLSYKHKNNKILYYFINYVRILIPHSYYQSKLQKKLDLASELLKDDAIKNRVDYYNKLNNEINLSDNALKLSDIKLEKGSKTYFFDLFEYSRFFNQNLRGFYLFGDIVDVPHEPGLLKSRPIGDDNANAVVLKWDKIRHFMFIKKDKNFIDKKNKLISRGKVHKPQTHRIKFLEKYFGHPLCNIGKVNNNDLNPIWKVDRMTIDEQLNYKFILCLEGNDVASNLKWVMSSNSLAVMPRPKYETWFMEGQLIPDHHYIHINDDYSNLEEKLNFYINNPDKALQIIENAHNYIKQFRNKQQEDLISLLVLNKYFEKTNQK